MVYIKGFIGTARTQFLEELLALKHAVHMDPGSTLVKQCIDHQRAREESSATMKMMGLLL